jgi:hypothetical protein
VETREPALARISRNLGRDNQYWQNAIGYL